MQSTCKSQTDVSVRLMDGAKKIKCSDFIDTTMAKLCGEVREVKKTSQEDAST